MNQEEKKPDQLTITVSPWVFETDALMDAVVDAVIRQGKLERLSKQVQKGVSLLVERVGQIYVEKKIKAMIDEVIHEGVPETDGYGEKTGRVVTAKGLLLERLTSTRQHSGGLLKEMIDYAIRRELKEEIDQARKEFREKLRAGLSAKLTEALASTLGIPT